MTLRTPIYLISGLIPLALVATGLIVSSKFINTSYQIEETIRVEEYEHGKYPIIDYITKTLNPPVPKYKMQLHTITTCTGVALCFFMMYCILPLVYEKEKKLKYALNVMGCR